MSAFVINSYAFGGEDPDAKAYLDAVESADTQALEAGVRKAVDDFVKGCKADGIWSAIKASCILAGARTLTGALVPLVGSAPTNENGNFVSGDYDRATGLKGNGSNKAILTGRNNNADGQNDFHLSVYVHTINTNTKCYIGTGGGSSGDSNIFDIGTTVRFRNRTSDGNDRANDNVAGFMGSSRGASGSYVARANGTNTTVTVTSQSPSTTEICVFKTPNVLPFFFSAARIRFYSIGTNLDLALLAARLDTLKADIDAAI